MSEELNLSDLGLIDDGDVVIDTNNLPRERSNVPRVIPQPGTHRFQLPTIDSRCIKAKTYDGRGQRIQLAFKDDVALQVVGGNSLNYTVSGLEREIYEDGQPTGRYSSELAYLVRACGYAGTLSNKADQVRAISAASGKQFLADVAYQTNCAADRNAYKDGEKQSVTGCGARYELKGYKKRDGSEVFSIPRNADGSWPSNFSCVNPECGADLMCFIRLSNYRPVV